MLHGTSALVTGSLGGIGFATARAHSELGGDTTLNGLATPEVIADRLAELRALGIRSRLSPLTFVTQTRPDKAMIATTQAEHGGPAILASEQRRRACVRPVEAFAPEHWDEARAVDLSAAFHAISLALPRMKAKGTSLPPSNPATAPLAHAAPTVHSGMRTNLGNQPRVPDHEIPRPNKQPRA